MPRIAAFTESSGPVEATGRKFALLVNEDGHKTCKMQQNVGPNTVTITFYTEHVDRGDVGDAVDIIERMLGHEATVKESPATKGRNLVYTVSPKG